MSTPYPSRDSSALFSGPLAWTEDLTVRFGRRTVLDRINIAVQPGEVVTLIGPNGAGKTTLVRAVLGLVAPDGGRVLRRPNLRVGYMPQRLSVDRTLPLTVRRFLALWRPVTADRVEAALLSSLIGAVLDATVLAVRELFPAREASWRIPMLLLCSASGMATGSWLAGYIYDHFGYYAPAFIAGIGVNLLHLAIVGTLVWRRHLRPVGA